MKRVGSREEVYNGIAIKTTGGMHKDDIIKIKQKLKTDDTVSKYNEKYISRKKSELIKKRGGIKKSLKRKSNSNYLGNTINDRINNRINNRIVNNVQNVKSNNTKKTIIFDKKIIMREYQCNMMNNDKYLDTNEMNIMNLDLLEL